MKKLISLVLALAMVMMIGAAFADDDSQQATATTPAYDATVTITNVAAGDVARFYQIVEWVNDAEDNVGGWKATSAFSSVLTKAVLTDVLGNPQANPVIPAKGISSTLANSLAAEADKTIDGVAVTGTSVSKTVDAPGIYMVLITAGDTDVVYNPVFVSSDYKDSNTTNTWSLNEDASYSDSAAAKKSTTTLDKKASTEEVKPDDMKWQTTAIGDTVHFEVTTTIPGFGPAFINPYFKVTDKLTDLKLVSGTVKIKSPSDAVATITPATDGLSYTIEFASAYLKTLTVPTKVTIEYDAIVTTTAPLNVNAEKNEVWTEYSHDISNENDHAFKKDTTQHYTFTLDADATASGGEQHGKRTSEIVKVGRKADGTVITDTKVYSQISEAKYWESPLAGAQFKLYRDAECKNEYIPKTTTGAAGTALDIVSDAEGRMTIAGLDAGEYWLREESAPDGFVKDSHVAHIVIDAKTTSKDVTEYTNDGVNWISVAAYNALDDKTGYKACTYATETLDSYTVTIDDVVAGSYTFKNTGNEVEIEWTEEGPVELPHQFVNTEGLELPSTGGIGTTIFYVLGGLLVVGAAIILVARRKAHE